MTTSQFGTPLSLPSQQDSEPWGNLRAPYPTPPSSFTRPQNFISGISRCQTGGYLQRRGSEGGVPQTYQQMNMVHGSREVSMVIQDTNFSRDGYRGGNGGSPTRSQPPSFQIASQESLDLSGSGQFEQRAAGERQEEEELPTPNPQTSGAPPPNSLEDVPIPVDLSQEENAMKKELGDLQEKLERSREDYNRRILQNDRYTRKETTALLKAIAWKGQLLMKIGDLPIRDIPVHMKSRLYWDSDFRGECSLLAKFREILGGGIRNRDGGSLKRKWNCVVEGIARAPFQFFKEYVSMAEEEMDDQDKIFLVILAKEWCLMKGVDTSDQGPGGPTAAPPQSPSSSVPVPPNSSGNPFWNEDPFKNSQGRDDMPVFLSGFPSY